MKSENELNIDKNSSIFIGTGRRKKSSAKIKLSIGNGNIKVNSKNINEYLELEYAVKIALSPIKLLNLDNKVNAIIKVHGGGKIGQAHAILLGIARALENMDPNYRESLKKAGFLTRDSKIKERKKPGQPKARKKFQFSKR